MALLIKTVAPFVTNPQPLPVLYLELAVLRKDNPMTQIRLDPAGRFIDTRSPARRWLDEIEREKAERLRLWEELREKVEKLPALMDAAKAEAEASGSLANGHIDGSEVGDLLFEIECLRSKLSIDFFI